MSLTIAVVICEGERFKITHEGQIQRFTENGWTPLHMVNSDDDDEYETLVNAIDVLFNLYGWEINEVNLTTELDDEQMYRLEQTRSYDGTVNDVTGIVSE